MPSRSRPLIAGLLALLLSAAPARAADLVGAYTWVRDAGTHGGYSGLEVDADGTGFVVLSDRAHLVRGEFLRENGLIAGVEVTSELRLGNTAGARMKQDFGDSEGLAIGPDGCVFVAFEGVPRVWRYDGARAEPLPRHRDFALLPANGALEALAIDADGALYTMPERAEGDLPFPVWRLADGVWELAFTLADRGYAITGADFDDRGRLYVLERRFLGIGFQTRVRRVTLDGDDVLSDETLIETDLRQFDNLEGIAVWRDGDGSVRITMVSDDNFNFVQRTEFVEYTVAD